MEIVRGLSILCVLKWTNKISESFKGSLVCMLCVLGCHLFFDRWQIEHS